MNKKLRFSLLSMLMMLCGSVFAEDVTFDFSTGDAYTLFGFSGFSSNESHDGDFTENGSTTSGDVTITVSPSGVSNANRMWSGSLRLYGGSVTIASAGQKITNIAFTLNSSKWSDGNSANTGTLTKGAWKGEASEVVVTIAGNTQIKSMTVTLGGEGGGGGGDQGDDEFTGPTVNDIAAFKALEKNTEAKLTLKDAEVLFAKGSDIFVRDASGAIDFYNTGLTLTAGQKLNGFVIGKYTVYNNLPELAKTDNTKANGYTATTGTVTPRNIGLDEVAGYVCDLVLINGVTIAKGEDNNYYASNEDGDKVQVYDKFKIGYEAGLEEGKSYDITCIVIAYKDIYELCPIEDFSGGSDVQPTAVPSVAALLEKSSPSANLELTLTDAQVLIVDNNYIYVRENGKAVCFYQMPSDVKNVLAKDAVVNGKIAVDYEVYKLMPEVKTNSKTNADNLTATQGEEAVPTETTVAQVAAGENVCDLVTLKATVTKETSEGGSNTYYLKDGDSKIVVVNNSKGLDKLLEDVTEVSNITVVGIANTNNNAHQIKLFKKVEDVTGINTVNVQKTDGQLYNVAGQRVSGSYKGIVIQNGKKMVVK